MDDSTLAMYERMAEWNPGIAIMVREEKARRERALAEGTDERLAAQDERIKRLEAELDRLRKAQPPTELTVRIEGGDE